MPITQILLTQNSGPSGPPPYAGSFFFNSSQTSYRSSITGTDPVNQGRLAPDGSYIITDDFDGGVGLWAACVGPLTTIEYNLWFYPTANNVSILVEQEVPTEGTGYRYSMLEIDSSGYVKARSWPGVALTSSNPVVLDAYNHIYFYHNGTTAVLELNGVPITDSSYNSRVGPGSTSYFGLAGTCTDTNMGSTNRFQGRIARFSINSYVAGSDYSIYKPIYQPQLRLSVDANITTSYPGYTLIAGEPNGYGDYYATFVQGNFTQGNIDQLGIGWTVTDGMGFNSTIVGIGVAGGNLEAADIWPTSGGRTYTFAQPTNRWADLSGAGRNVTLYNTPTFYDATVPKYFTFDPNSLEYGKTSSIMSLGSWTVESWFRITSSLSATQATAVITTVYNDEETNTNYGNINFCIGNNSVSPGNTALKVGFFDGGWRECTGVVPAIGDWIHMIGTFDGSILREYYNGTENSTLSYVGTSSSNGGMTRIARRWDGPENAVHYFPGDIGLVRVYAGALTPGEVAKRWADTRATYGK